MKEMGPALSVQKACRFLLLFMLLFMLLPSLPACTPHYQLKALRAELDSFSSQRSPVIDLKGYQDLRGAIHVHSHLSHDSGGTAEEILQGAREAGLDYVILTDHDTPRIFEAAREALHVALDERADPVEPIGHD